MSTRWFCVVLVVVAVTQTLAADNPGVRALLRVYDECSNAPAFGACLKKKALVFVDRLARMDKITVAEGFAVVRANDAPAPPATPTTDDEIEKSLPRNLEVRDAALNNMLMDKAASYVSSRTLQITLPEVTGRELSRGLEEGRGKMKKMMGMMMMGVAAKMAGMIPLAMAGLFLMAGKALMISKIALLLAVIIALKKIIANKSGGGGGHGGGGGGGGHGAVWHSSGGGWDKRSYEEAQKMAYKAYTPQ